MRDYAAPDTFLNRPPMPNPNIDVVSIGNILKETIVYPGESIGPVLGSPCAYTSLVMAKLGLKAGIVSYYGKNLGEDLLNELRLVDKAGLIDYLYATENHLIYREDGSKGLEYYKTAPVIQFHSIPEEYMDARLYFVCPMNYEVSLDLCFSLQKHKKTIMIDLGGYGGTTTYNHFAIDTPRGMHYLESLCRAANIVKVSREDLSHIIPGRSLEEASRIILDLGAEIAVIPMGEDGAAYLVAGGGLEHVEAFTPRGDPAGYNAVGAGDAFAGGFICNYIKTGEVHSSVVYGNAVASLVMEKPGACVESRMPGSDMADLRKDRVV